ncbi:MAG: glycosyltransferase family 2 protein, partial [Pyrinomonadaceae bacterium]
MKISAVLITFNEEKQIAAALESVAWADEIIVVDSESTDATRVICEKSGAKVLVQKWIGFSEQKQFAVDNAGHDWIFSLDTDERVSHELQSEILAIKEAAVTVDGYKIPRLS